MITGILALLSGVAVVGGIFVLAFFILIIVAKWIVYQKCGKQGWEAIIPIYSSWILVEITGVKQWFFYCLIASFIAILIPGLNGIAGIIALAASFCCHYNLALKFKKEPVGYAIGLTFLPFIFFPILAFSDSEYHNVKVSPYGPISEGTVDNRNANDSDKSSDGVNFCKNCGSPVKDEKYCSKCGTKLH